MESSSNRIRWHKPEPSQRYQVLAVAPLTSVEAELHDVQLQALLHVGVPIVEGITTAREFAIELLKLAAEVEHALMVQYLYSANSILNSVPGQENYQKKLLNVAIQEMGHLATVQNLLLLLDGPASLHMQRDHYRRKVSEKNPMPFVLEPVSRTVLAKNVAVEMPAIIPAELRPKVNTLVEIAERDAGVELHRVGAIYATLKWIFLPAHEARHWIDLAMLAPLPANPHLTDSDLRPMTEVAAFEARADEWSATMENFILETPHSCADVVVAIDKIAAQGEGFGEALDSHFVTFLGFVDAFDAGKFAAKALPMSPTLGGEDGGERGQEILNRYTRAWAKVFNLQYSLMVLTIYHALRTSRDSDVTLRHALVDLAMRGMRRTVDSLSDVLVSLPIRDGSVDPAGPPYELDPKVLDVSDDRKIVERHIELLDSLKSQYEMIENYPEFASHPTHRNELVNLRNYDKRRRDLFT
jgi:hypothetical protein